MRTAAALHCLLLGATLLFAADTQEQDQDDSQEEVYTSFSCRGRVGGYYADIESGCQLYHLCDGAGRQFTHACPNQTLFQQRMMVCDHWYMVNCSLAELDYAANLLLGRRDQPFMQQHEHVHHQHPRVTFSTGDDESTFQRIPKSKSRPFSGRKFLPNNSGKISFSISSLPRTTSSEDPDTLYRSSEYNGDSDDSYSQTNSKRNPQDPPLQRRVTAKVSPERSTVQPYFGLQTGGTTYTWAGPLEERPRGFGQRFRNTDQLSTSPVLRQSNNRAFSTAVYEGSSPSLRRSETSTESSFRSQTVSSIHISSLSTSSPIYQSSTRPNKTNRFISNVNIDRRLQNIPVLQRENNFQSFSGRRNGFPDKSRPSIAKVEKIEKPFISSTPQSSTERSPEYLPRDYTNNPFFKSYFRSSSNTGEPVGSLPPATSTPAPRSPTSSVLKTGQLYSINVEDVGNHIELFLPDHRRMFFIPDNDADLIGDLDSDLSKVLVIPLPSADHHHGNMRFRSDEREVAGQNPECPRCHPAFLLPGTCEPCVRIR